MDRTPSRLRENPPAFDGLLRRLAESQNPKLVQIRRRATKPSPYTYLKTSKKRRQRLAWILPLLFSSILITGVVFWFSADTSWYSSSHGLGQLKAALVDELSATVPNPSFVMKVQRDLGNAGYTVDYYPPSQVTVNLFQNLPTRGYELVLIRAHSGETAIYTSEAYSKTKYVYEQLTDQIVPVDLNGHQYFAITQKFVEESLHGSFDQALIVSMGCSGLSGTEMARAFLDRGAKAYTGWDRAVSPRQTDESIMFLVQLITQGKTIREAVGLTTDHFAGTPDFQSQLGYYDLSVAPRHQAGLSLTGLAGLTSVVLVICCGPFAVILIPRLFGRR